MNETDLTTGADTFKLGMPTGPFPEAVGSNQVRLPGRGIPMESNLQFVEPECETAEEFYDAFLREKSMAMTALGFPEGSGGGAYAPFDAIGDFIQGTRGMMLDMFRCPDKIIDAIERLTPMILETGLDARKSLSPFVFIPLHKGCEGFMSLEQYKVLYWPTLRKVIMGLIEEGLVPVVFFEGVNTSRLEVISDIPAGKAIYHFENVDLNKAREVLDGRICFRGNVPISLLHTGTPDDVAVYVRKLIDTFGRDGGLIVDSGAIFDEAKSENIQAMVEAVKDYGA